MKLLSLSLLVLLTATVGLAFFNWPLFIVPDKLSLGFMTAQAPLSLVLLGILVLVTALFLINIAYLLSSSMIEIRRHTRELEMCRELANKAEASRVTELKNHFTAELSKQKNLNEELRSVIIERSDQIETNFRIIIEQLENTFDAYIGELEDRLERTRLLPPDKDL